MIYHIFALILLCLMSFLTIVLRFSLYSPLVINTFIWMVVFITGLFFHERYYPLQENVFLAWLIWFVVTSFIFLTFDLFRGSNAWRAKKIRRLPVDYTLLLLILIAWLSYRIWIIGSTGPAHFFLNLRLASIGAEGVASYGILGRFYPLVFALFLFEHVYENKENKHLRILLWVWMLLYAFATMGKFSLLTPFVAWGIIRGIKGQLQFSKIFLLGPALLLLMIIIHISRASASSIFSFADMWSTYVYSPLVALGYMDINPANQYVLRFFYAVGYRLGIAPKPVNVISPYVYVPEATNVFTVMQPFYHDWGLLGVFWGALVYALFFSLLYFYSKKEKGFALILFSGYSIALIGQFIVDLLIMHFSGNLQLFIWATLIYVFSRKADVSC